MELRAYFVCHPCFHYKSPPDIFLNKILYIRCLLNLKVCLSECALEVSSFYSSHLAQRNFPFIRWRWKPSKPFCFKPHIQYHSAFLNLKDFKSIYWLKNRIRIMKVYNLVFNIFTFWLNYTRTHWKKTKHTKASYLFSLCHS